jgi:predicted DNA-binding transcriptional regulator AlpA
MEGTAMARIALFTESHLLDARRIRDKDHRASEIIQALAVLLPAEIKLNAMYTTRVLGISERTLFRYQADIHTPPKESWGGRRHAFLSTEEEEAFLSPWAVQAEKGGVLTVPPIHRALMDRLGKKIPQSTTYRLLARHGWRKVEPDTRHPKSDPAAQASFKKNFLRRWRPPARKITTDY